MTSAIVASGEPEESYSRNTISSRSGEKSTGPQTHVNQISKILHIEREIDLERMEGVVRKNIVPQEHDSLKQIESRHYSKKNSS